MWHIEHCIELHWEHWVICQPCPAAARCPPSALSAVAARVAAHRQQRPGGRWPRQTNRVRDQPGIRALLARADRKPSSSAPALRLALLSAACDLSYCKCDGRTNVSEHGRAGAGGFPGPSPPPPPPPLHCRPTAGAPDAPRLTLQQWSHGARGPRRGSHWRNRHSGGGHRQSLLGCWGHCCGAHPVRRYSTLGLGAALLCILASDSRRRCSHCRLLLCLPLPAGCMHALSACRQGGGAASGAGLATRRPAHHSC